MLDVLGFDEDNIIDLRDAKQSELRASFGNDRGYEGSMLWRYLDPEGRSGAARPGRVVRHRTHDTQQIANDAVGAAPGTAAPAANRSRRPIPTLERPPDRPSSATQTVGEAAVTHIAGPPYMIRVLCILEEGEAWGLPRSEAYRDVGCWRRPRLGWSPTGLRTAAMDQARQQAA